MPTTIEGKILRVVLPDGTEVTKPDSYDAGYRQTPTQRSRAWRHTRYSTSGVRAIAKEPQSPFSVPGSQTF